MKRKDIIAYLEQEIAKCRELKKEEENFSTWSSGFLAGGICGYRDALSKLKEES
jgi:hypothetical protein